MINFRTIGGLAAALALSASPALALPSAVPSSAGAAPTTTPPSNQGTANKPATPGPGASLPAKAKAYGSYCKTESRKHVAGTPGTPFSACVTAMAKVAHGQTNPTTACKAESKKHVAGTPGTPFSACVSGAAKLLKNQADSSSTDSAATDS